MWYFFVVVVVFLKMVILSQTASFSGLKTELERIKIEKEQVRFVLQFVLQSSMESRLSHCSEFHFLMSGHVTGSPQLSTRAHS